MKPRQLSQIDQRTKECDEASNFSNATVLTSKPEQKHKQRIMGDGSHTKQPSFSIESQQQRRARGGQLQDTYKIKQKSFDNQIQVGSGSIYRNQQQRSDQQSIPTIEANNRVSVQQIAAQNNIDLLNYYSTHTNGLQSSKILEEKLCSISSSLALIPDEDKLNECEMQQPGTGRITATDNFKSDNSSQPTNRPTGLAGLHSSHTHSFGGGDRSSIRVENDGDEELIPGRDQAGTLASVQTLPSLQNSNMQINHINSLNNNLNLVNDGKNYQGTKKSTIQSNISQVSIPIQQQTVQKMDVKNPPPVTTLTDSPQKSQMGYHPMTSINKSLVTSSGGATTMISINMSEKNNQYQSLKSQNKESTLESKFLKRKVEINEPYNVNTHNNMKQIEQQLAYQKQIAASASFQQRFSTNFPSSSDLYGAALRGGGLKNDSGSRYFQKSKFSVNSQQLTKNFNSVLSAIKEGPSREDNKKLRTGSHFESFEHRDSLSSLRGQRQESTKLKHKNIQIVEKNQKHFKSMSKRFLNNSVTQKKTTTSTMNVSLPLHKVESNQASVGNFGEFNQSELKHFPVNNYADHSYKNMNQPLSRQFLKEDSISRGNFNNRESSKILSISTSDNCQNTKGHNVLNIFEDTMTKLSQSRKEMDQNGDDLNNNQGQIFSGLHQLASRPVLKKGKGESKNRYQQSVDQKAHKIFSQVVATTIAKQSQQPPIVGNHVANEKFLHKLVNKNNGLLTKCEIENKSTDRSMGNIDANKLSVQTIGMQQQQNGPQLKQLHGPVRSMADIAMTSSNNYNLGSESSPVNNNRGSEIQINNYGIQQLQMGPQQNAQRKTIHGKKKRNVPMNDILDSFKKAQNGFASDQILNQEIKNQGGGGGPATGQIVSTTGYPLELKRVSNRTSLQPKSQIQDNENVIINSSRVNKTQKKNKLKIQDHHELESYRVSELYKEKMNGGNTSSSAWKITSISVKNTHKSLAQRASSKNKLPISNTVVANSNYSNGTTSNKDTHGNSSPSFAMKPKGQQQQRSQQSQQKITSETAAANGTNSQVKKQQQPRLQFQNSSPQLLNKNGFNNGSKNSNKFQKLDTINELKATQISVDSLETRNKNNGNFGDGDFVNQGQQQVPVSEEFNGQTNNKNDTGIIGSNQLFSGNQMVGLTPEQTIKILDNNLNGKIAAQNTQKLDTINKQEFSEYQDISSLNRDYFDIVDMHHGCINTSHMGGRNNIKINVNKDRGILEDLSYFSQDLEELSQNNKMSLKFYDFNGFKSSLSHRGTNSSGTAKGRPDESTRSGRRFRNQQPKVSEQQKSDMVLAISGTPPDDSALQIKDSLKTTEGRFKSNIESKQKSNSKNFRTVRPPDSQQMLRRPQQVRQNNQLFEQICLKNEGSLLAVSNSMSNINKQDDLNERQNQREENNGASEASQRFVSSPYFGQVQQQTSSAELQKV